MQHLHSTTLDSAAVNGVTSKSVTYIGEKIKQCNINGEMKNSAALNRATWISATSNSGH